MSVFGLGASLVLSIAPLAVAQSIPDLATLLQEVEAHQHKMDEVRENYTFHRIRRTEDLDKNGAILKTTTLERQVFFVNGRQIGRLMKKDGVELNAAEEKSEQARVRILVERFTKLQPATRPGGQVGLIGQILKVAKISNPRRISLNGRDTLVFDFAGDPRASADGMEQSAEKKSAGTIWIDQADRQVARLEVRLDDNFRVGGVLASFQKGTSLKMEQSPIGNGLWMQTTGEQHVEARLVVKRLRRNVHVKDTDFKRFDVDTFQNIGLPSR